MFYIIALKTWGIVPFLIWDSTVILQGGHGSTLESQDWMVSYRNTVCVLQLGASIAENVFFQPAPAQAQWALEP